MGFDPEQIAGSLFELASEQRISILVNLHENEYTVSRMAKKLEATAPEIFRNFERLTKAGLIVKGSDSNYSLTTYGKTLCAQIPSLVFVPHHAKFFSNHNFGNLPTKFIQRIGQLDSGKQIKGFVKVIEKWKDIYKNADEYIFNILTEIPYEKDSIEAIVSKLKNGIQVKSIFSESAVIPNERKKVLSKISFKKFIDEGLLERKMKKEVDVVVILNEKEAGAMFSSNDGDVDMAHMLYSNDSEFHDWCLDYFKYCHENSSRFQESKLEQ